MRWERSQCGSTRNQIECDHSKKGLAILHTNQKYISKVISKEREWD